MRYLKGTIDFGIYYVGDINYRLYGYTYAHWVVIVLDRKRCVILSYKNEVPKRYDRLWTILC